MCTHHTPGKGINGLSLHITMCVWAEGGVM